MGSDMDSKRLSDEDLEGVAGGVTHSPLGTMDPTGSMYAAAVAAHQMPDANHFVSPPAAHADSGPAANTHVTVSGDQVFGGSLAVSHPHDTAPALVVTGTVHLSNPLTLNVPAPPPEQTVTVMHFDSSQGEFHKVIPNVVGTDPGPDTITMVNGDVRTVNHPNLGADDLMRMGIASGS